MLRELPKKSDKHARAATLHLLGGAQLPQEVAEVIQKARSTVLSPRFKRTKMLSLNRRTAGKAEQADHERCLLEGCGCPAADRYEQTFTPPAVHGHGGGALPEQRAAAYECGQRGWVCGCTKGMFLEKAMAVVHKNFIPAKLKPQKPSLQVSERHVVQSVSSKVREPLEFWDNAVVKQ
ncbi:hypothetical protein HPB48_001681 [Haemaphysalis longicornis]|uniref:Uncharacterized protein n=1 Tax=Haemaphysalis longicornis TaxID=44386 RepID=A0A9J6FB51_HAELO|nr:hypothetical protein HPB48_001681 [Haemaphysalis longicornis]